MQNIALVNATFALRHMLGVILQDQRDRLSEASKQIIIGKSFYTE